MEQKRRYKPCPKLFKEEAVALIREQGYSEAERLDHWVWQSAFGNPPEVLSCTVIAAHNTRVSVIERCLLVMVSEPRWEI